MSGIFTEMLYFQSFMAANNQFASKRLSESTFMNVSKCFGLFVSFVVFLSARRCMLQQRASDIVPLLTFSYTSSPVTVAVLTLTVNT